MIGVEGLDALIRSVDDLARLASGLFQRGVRLFQPIYGETSKPPGAARPLPPGMIEGSPISAVRFLEVMAGLESVKSEVPRPRPLARPRPHEPGDDGRSPRPGSRPNASRGLRRFMPVYSHGAPVASRALSRPERSRSKTWLEGSGRWGDHVGLSDLTAFFPVGLSRSSKPSKSLPRLPFRRAGSGFEGIAHRHRLSWASTGPYRV